MLRAIIQSARLSNLPTVWTNVLVGAAAAGWATDGLAAAAWAPLWTAMGVVSLLYVGGMFLNDAVDAEWDRRHKPDRPIARGLVPRALITILAACCLVASIAVAMAFGLGNRFTQPAVMQSGVFLGGMIVLYNVVHKRTAWSVVLMGACRGLVYLFALSVIVDEPNAQRLTRHSGVLWSGDALLAVLPPVLAIIAYITLVTLAARREDVGGARLGPVWAWLLPAPYLVAASWFRPDRLLWTMFVAAAFLAWTIRSARVARSGNIPGAVSGWLAGICLADATLLMLMNRPDLAPPAVACWLLTVLLQRSIPGT